MKGAECWVLVLVLGAVLGAGAPAFAQQPPAAQAPKKPRQFEIRGYFTAGTEKTESPKTFDAVLGTERLTLLGGGGEVVITRRWIARGQFTRFSGTGTRVFVDSNRTVFPLTIPLDVTIDVTEFSGGYRFLARPRWGAFMAAGRTSYTLSEESNGERDRDSGSGWHLLGGVDVKPHTWIVTAAEVQWTNTENIFGAGAAEALGESRLGGLRFAFRIGFAF